MNPPSPRWSRTGSRAMRLFATGILAIAVSSCSDSNQADPQPRPVRLETDADPDPLGLDARNPRLSWRIAAGRPGAAQTAYEVALATSATPHADDAAGVWRSGKIESSAPFVDYAGPPLAPRTRYYWTVRVWDEQENPSPWAAVASFETGFLDPSAWTADWIAGPERDTSDTLGGIASAEDVAASGDFCRPVGPIGPLSLEKYPQATEYRDRAKSGCRAIRPAPLLRRSFDVGADVLEARLYVAGLAYADVYLNGRRLGGGHVLDPGFTDYAKTVLYNTYDVTEELHEGRNAIAVELGSGFFDYDVVGEWWWTDADWRARPRMLLELHAELDDGSELRIASDGSWRTAHGPTRYDNINIGETYDARFAIPNWAEADFDDGSWQLATVVEPPAGRLLAQSHEPIAIVEQRDTVSESQPSPGVTVFDVGEQVTGWAGIEVAAPKGTTAQISYGETLLADGTVDLRRNLHVADRLQTDYFVSSGSGRETWRPRFSYKGFRHVQVSGPRGTPLTGELGKLRVDVVRSALQPIGSFECSHPLLNGIFANARRAIANNLHGIVTDTPVYEKNGWTGDAQLTAPAAMSLFDMRRFYRKWLRDIRDSQLASGEIPTIVPSGAQYGYTGVGWQGTWGATPAWDAALFIIPWEAYLRYGDERFLSDNYDAMRAYVDQWIPQWAEGHLVDSNLGDHLSPSSTVNQLLSTAYYAQFATILAEVSDLKGLPAEAERYRRLRRDIERAFHAAYFDADGGYYRQAEGDGFVQTANLLPLAFDLVPSEHRDAVAAAVVADVEKRGGHLATGVVGARYILSELTRAGYPEVAFTIATRTDAPSWGQWLELGYTALAENWGPAFRSFDHHFFGSIVQWFFESVAGIAPRAPGYAEISFRPGLRADGLGYAEASIDTVRGLASVCWRRDADAFVAEVTVPPNAVGFVHIADYLGQVVPAEDGPAVERSQNDGGGIIYTVAAGTYRFHSRGTNPGGC